MVAKDVAVGAVFTIVIYLMFTAGLGVALP